MNKLLLLLSILFFTLQAQGQSTIAKLKYEQAEEAFGKNDFYTTLTKLDDVDKMLGETTPKTMYLRIMSQAKLLDEDTTLLQPLKKNCSFYLKKYDGNENIEDKYKEVFLVSENLMQYEENQDHLTGRKYLEEKNYEEALKYTKKAAATGYARSFVNMGIMYENGYGVMKDYAEALQWYRRAAEKGNAWGLYYLGRMYYHGMGVGANYTEALNLFLQAAAKNNLLAIVGVADAYCWKLNDCGKAFEWYKKAADKGNVWSMRMLGQNFYFGSGVTKDYTQAMQWCLRAAEKGEHDAMNFIGVMYKSGYGVAVNYQTALEWYLKAAEKGNTYAMGNIAEMYQNGWGVKKSSKLAKEWREKQAAAKAKQ